jgi:hypothetical protein
MQSHVLPIVLPVLVLLPVTRTEYLCSFTCLYDINTLTMIGKYHHIQ